MKILLLTFLLSFSAFAQSIESENSRGILKLCGNDVFEICFDSISFDGGKSSVRLDYFSLENSIKKDLQGLREFNVQKLDIKVFGYVNEEAKCITCFRGKGLGYVIEDFEILEEESSYKKSVENTTRGLENFKPNLEGVFLNSESKANKE